MSDGVIEESDVLVIGAGISGLYSAKVLHNFGLSVSILEARDRVGGRTLTVHDPRSGYCDLGGAYIGSTQPKVINLVRELSLELYQINSEGHAVHHFLGKRKLNKSIVPSGMSLLGILDINNFWNVLDNMSKKVPLEEPWLAAEAELWDQMTVKEFINETCWTRYGKSVASVFVQGMLTSEAHELSLLSFLWYIHSGGGVIRNWEASSNGAQEFKVTGGSQQISIKLAQQIGVEKVHLNSDVISIDQTNGAATVVCKDGKQYKAKRVIITVSPALLNRIRFNPPLPALKFQAYQRIPVGSIIKTSTFYNTAFWSEQGLSGIFACDDGVVEEAYDDSKPDGSNPAIMGFILGDRARDVAQLTKDERKKLVCEHYAKIYGCEEALNPVNYLEKNWMEDEFAGGCYVGVFPPGVLSKYGKVLRERFGSVHFAGTLMAIKWAGYMEGAIESGERAALEVANSLGKIDEQEFHALKGAIVLKDFPFLEFSLFRKHLMPSVPAFVAGLSLLSVGSLFLWLSLFQRKGISYFLSSVTATICLKH